MQRKRWVFVVLPAVQNEVCVRVCVSLLMLDSGLPYKELKKYTKHKILTEKYKKRTCQLLRRFASSGGVS